MKQRKFQKKNKENKLKKNRLLLICVGISVVMISIFIVFMMRGESEDKIHILGIGVDKYEIMGEREPVYNSIGQADGIFLITIDKKKETVDIVAVPRDTMVTIQKYYSNMEYIGEERAQICLQYAYADGKERSCELMVDCVEALFDGIEIEGYVAINMASVLEINEAIGGVTVEVHNEDTAQKMGIEVGSSVHLTEDNISLYLQSRDKTESKSAYGRMDRLKDYIKAFIPQALEEVKKNPGFVVDMMSVLGQNMITDLGITEITQLATTMAGISVDDISYQTLEGEVVMGPNGYEEFQPNGFKLKRIIQKMK